MLYSVYLYIAYALVAFSVHKQNPLHNLPADKIKVEVTVVSLIMIVWPPHYLPVSFLSFLQW